MPRLILLDNQPSGFSSLALGAAEGLGQGMLQQEQRRNALADRRAIMAEQLGVQNAEADRRENFAREQAATGYSRQVERDKVRAELMDKNYQRSRADKLWDQVDQNEIRAGEKAAEQNVRDKALGVSMFEAQERSNRAAADDERAAAQFDESKRHNRAIEGAAAGKGPVDQADAEISFLRQKLGQWQQDFNTARSVNDAAAMDKARAAWNQTNAEIKAKLTQRSQTRPAIAPTTDDPFLKALGGSP